MLAHIWSLSDIQNRGKLNADEFAVAMHLIYQKINGHDLPRSLPEDLVPPSQRDLKDLTNLAKLDAIQQKTMKRISPSSSLMGLVGMEPVLPAQVSQIENEEQRESLLKRVEERRKELAGINEEIGIMHLIRTV